MVLVNQKNVRIIRYRELVEVKISVVDVPVAQWVNLIDQSRSHFTLCCLGVSFNHLTKILLFMYYEIAVSFSFRRKSCTEKDIL